MPGGDIHWPKGRSWHSTLRFQIWSLLTAPWLSISFQHMRLPLLLSSTSLPQCQDSFGLVCPRWLLWQGTLSAVCRGGFGQWMKVSKEKWQRRKPPSWVSRGRGGGEGKANMSMYVSFVNAHGEWRRGQGEGEILVPSYAKSVKQRWCLGCLSWVCVSTWSP